MGCIDRDEIEYKGNGIGGHTQENFESAIKKAEKKQNKYSMFKSLL